ncbi:MAG: hypothetical protein AAF497_25910, partial [Planctomycetota bacterium]
RALKRHPWRDRVEHRVFKNPKGRKKGVPPTLEAQLRDAAHFASDLCHKLMRHSLSEHRRETISHAKRHNAVMERMMVFMVWRNFIKFASEREPIETPAMRIGIAERQLDWETVLCERLLPSRIPASPSWMHIHGKNWETPELGNNSVHRRVYAI